MFCFRSFISPSSQHHQITICALLCSKKFKSVVRINEIVLYSVFHGFRKKLQNLPRHCFHHALPFVIHSDWKRQKAYVLRAYYRGGSRWRVPGVRTPTSEMKPSSSYSLLKFVYLIRQLRHSSAVDSLLRKILDPPLY